MGDNTIHSMRNDFDSTVFLFVNITSIRLDTSRRLDETHAYRFHLLCMAAVVLIIFL